jgi:hypothetical protein
MSDDSGLADRRSIPLYLSAAPPALVAGAAALIVAIVLAKGTL